MAIRRIKAAVLLLILDFAPLILHSQGLKQGITGRVVDATTGQVIVGATVTLLNSNPILGDVTDTDGKYEVKQVPVGRHDVKISFVGYETYIQRGVLVTSSKPYLLDVALRISFTNLEEIVVTAPNDKQPLNKMAKVSARSFSLEESQRFAGGLSDPSRVAYSFAGVTFGAPQDNGVVIRGNSPTNVLWRIEGVEVPGASHFGGGNLAGAGLITIFSANVLGTSDFFTGAFPAEYGNATAGVFDINFRRGSTEKAKYTLQLGVLGADIAAEGPLGNKNEASYLANYRHGFIGYYGRLAGGVEPDYQDLSFKATFPAKKGGILSFWGIGGRSAIFTPYGEYEVEEDEIERRETEGDFQQDDIDFDMAAVGINHKVPLGKKSFINSSIAFTTNGYRSLTDWFTPDADTLNSGSLTPYTDIENRESKYTFTTNFIRQFSRRINNTTGVIIDFIDYSSRAKQADRPLEPLEEFVNTVGNTYNFQAYTQSDVQLTPKLSLQAGMNVTHFGINAETTLEPRAGLSWQVVSKLTLGLGYGRHSRREEPKVYFFDYLDQNGAIRTNESLKRAKADHFVASLNWELTHSLRLTLEGYYQDLFDVPVVPDSSYSFINYTQLWELDAPLTNDGTGKNLGVDITLEQSFHKNYYYLFTTSLFDSKFTGGDGIERNTLFNRGYMGTLTTGREFIINDRKKNRVNLLGINVNMTYMDGQRLTPVLVEESRARQEAVLDYDRLYSVQSEPELWLNCGVTYRINKRNSTVTWGLDFQNATLLEQWQGYEYNFVTDQVDEDRVLFLLPNLYYKLEF